MDTMHGPALPTLSVRVIHPNGREEVGTMHHRNAEWAFGGRMTSQWPDATNPRTDTPVRFFPGWLASGKRDPYPSYTAQGSPDTQDCDMCGREFSATGSPSCRECLTRASNGDE